MTSIIAKYQFEQKFIEDTLLPRFEPKNWKFDVRFVPTGEGLVKIYGFKDDKNGNRRAAVINLSIDLAITALGKSELDKMLDVLISTVGFEMDRQKLALEPKKYHE